MKTILDSDWEWVDIQQVERRERELAELEDTPGVLFWLGCAWVLVLALGFWGLVTGIVWLANTLIGGG